MFVSLFNGNKSLQKDINDSAGDGESNSFCNGLLLLVVAAAQTNNPSNKVIISIRYSIYYFDTPLLLFDQFLQFTHLTTKLTLPIFLRLQMRGVFHYRCCLCSISYLVWPLIGVQKPIEYLQLVFSLSPSLKLGRVKC